VKDAEALDKMKAYGTKILPVPKEIDDELIKVANKYFDEQAAKDTFFKEVIDSQRKFKALADLQGVR